MFICQYLDSKTFIAEFYLHFLSSFDLKNEPLQFVEESMGHPEYHIQCVQSEHWTLNIFFILGSKGNSDKVEYLNWNNTKNHTNNLNKQISFITKKNLKPFPKWHFRGSIFEGGFIP